MDDNSSDGTQLQINDMQNKFPNKIFLIERPCKLGLGTAYVRGFDWGIQHDYEALIEMDADLSHDPKYLPTILKLLETHDFVVGSRYVPGGGAQNWGFMRRVISRFGSLYASTILNTKVHDFTGGFNAWKPKVLKSINFKDCRSDGYVFQIELKYRSIKEGWTFTETPIIFKDRVHGLSKMSFNIVLEAIYKVIMLRFYRHSPGKSQSLRHNYSF